MREIIPLKRFGQNFLIDKNILKNIIERANLCENDVILEIGPGKGILTEAILKKKVSCLHSVELDERFKKLLEKISEREKNLVLHWGDALKINYSDFSPFPKKVIANIPYNITTPLIWKLLSFAKFGMTYHLYMLQKEVAERLTAKADSKERYPLGITLEAMGNVNIFKKVSRSCFRPIPKVDSALVEIIITKNFEIIENSLWSEILHKAFSHRRKNLMNNLKGFKNLSVYELKEIFDKSEIDPLLRAEDIECQNWLKFYKIISFAGL